MIFMNDLPNNRIQTRERNKYKYIYIYTVSPNLGLETAILGLEREQGRFRGSRREHWEHSKRAEGGAVSTVF